MNRISFLNRGYAFKGLLPVKHEYHKIKQADNSSLDTKIMVRFVLFWPVCNKCNIRYHIYS